MTQTFFISIKTTCISGRNHCELASGNPHKIQINPPHYNSQRFSDTMPVLKKNPLKFCLKGEVIDDNNFI